MRTFRGVLRGIVFLIVDQEECLARERGEASTVAESAWLHNLKDQRNEFKKYLKKVYKNHREDRANLRAELKEKYTKLLDERAAEIARLKDVIEEREAFVKGVQEAWVVIRAMSGRLDERIENVNVVSSTLNDRFAELNRKASRMVDEIQGSVRYVKRVSGKMQQWLGLSGADEETILRRLVDSGVPVDVSVGDSDSGKKL
jgi:predicted nuclease with TOPRIM domain